MNSNRGLGFVDRWLEYFGDILVLCLMVGALLLFIGAISLPLILLGPWGLFISVPLFPIGLATLVAATPG